MTKHALLSASSAYRWLNCPPSVRLSEGIQDQPSEYAAEGTDAHLLCSHKLEKALGMPTEDPTENLTYYNAEMEACANEYAAYVLELYEKAKETCPDPVVMIEQKADFSRYVPDGFGTADCILIADGTLNIVDYKHGKGVEVDAHGNPQMMLYALGALEIFDGLYDIDTIQMTIFQPRLGNISVSELKKDELLAWAKDTLVPKAKLAYEGKGETAAGPWCRFCKIKAQCRNRAEANLELAKLDFTDPPLLSDEEIEEVLAKIDNLVSWAGDVKNFALEQAIGGKHWNGYKLVEGRSNRKYTNEQEVAKTVLSAGFDPYEQKLKGITAMTALLGRKKFTELLGNFITKPQGKPTLVPESDKRPEMTTAADEFKEEKNYE